MKAEKFLTMFHNILPSQWGGEFSRPSGSKKQTEFISEILHRMVKQADMGCCCNKGEHASVEEWDTAIKEQGLDIEYMFDFTWFKEWVLYEQPSVIIEHENSDKPEDFFKDFWKILVGFAPLRIMIGYTKKPDLWKQYLHKMNDLEQKAQWRYPIDADDLVLIGHWKMEPRKFRVIRRKVGEVHFEDNGWLSELYS